MVLSEGLPQIFRGHISHSSCLFSFPELCEGMIRKKVVRCLEIARSRHYRRKKNVIVFAFE